MIYLIIFSAALNIVLTILLLLKPKSKNKTTETKDLIDFITDLKIHGYGVVRIDPDSLLYISPKSK